MADALAKDNAPVNATTGTMVSAVPTTYYGFSLRETAGANATVQIFDNVSASGVLLDTIQLAPGESARDWYGGGVAARIGIYVNIVTGTIEGSVRYQ